MVDSVSGDPGRNSSADRCSGFSSLEDMVSLADELFRVIAEKSADVEGVSRPAFSETETAILEYLRHVAEENGLAAWYDAGQNLLISLPEDKDAHEYILIGSHVDSVPRGGNYDGLAGVVAGLLMVLKAQKTGKRFRRPVRAIAMRGEESVWFGPCYMASKLLLGQLAESELASVHKGDGRTLEAHLEDLGIDVPRIREQQPLLNRGEVLEYIELHIEQGPLLAEKKIPAAVVSGIRGNIRHRYLQCIGTAGHSGAVPRAFRRDPVMALADLLSRLDESWLTILQKGDDLVLTSGIVATDPEVHAVTRIPDRVTFSLDCRSQSLEALEEMRWLIRQEMNQVERDRRVRFEVDRELMTPPALMDEKIISGLLESMSHTGLEPFVMPSGGGHDAAVFANAGVPCGMVFVRNDNGSHNPAESMDTEDFLRASTIIYDYLAAGKTR